MIKRIVKMTFREEETERFEEIFHDSCERIRACEGCEYLELTRSATDPRIYFTISLWRDESHLDRYRNSDLFKTTWSATKALFEDKPRAWSTESVKILA